MVCFYSLSLSLSCEPSADAPSQPGLQEGVEIDWDPGGTSTGLDIMQGSGGDSEKLYTKK